MFCAALAMAQFVAAGRGQITTRAQEIEADRQKKAAELQPEELSNIERRILQFQQSHILDKITNGIGGIRPKIGGLITGSGFTLGPEYYRDDLASGKLIFRTSARFSTRRYQLYDLELEMPRLANDRVFLDLLAMHRNYPQMDYYGPGPHSKLTGRSDYRLEDTSADFRGGVRPVKAVRLGVTGGYVAVNTGDGTNQRLASTPRIYNASQTPGVDRQSNFLRGGVFAALDTRDNPGGPRRGLNYSGAYTYYRDTELERYSFRRLDVELQNYLPFLNERRVIALRAKSTLTYANPGQSVPFYFQPVVGGSEDLRGFRNFRFYDNNMIAMTAEYRYEIFAGLDMALFADAGKVFPRPSEWNFDDLEASYGIGMRFNVRNSVFMRIDAGFSREGAQVWVKFNNVF
ncbi:MAG TPA: BamA/TamA family outer membrane protein [Bryobacteraceae bacterium]|nr:BamA/TamA family outer membrane protein [Bryobacteraceae bacterium]